jgi:hypothetical protein
VPIVSKKNEKKNQVRKLNEFLVGGNMPFLDSRMRSGDELYTPEYVILKLQKYYDLYNKKI